MKGPSNPILAFPMHGQLKLLAEGYRTRDGHLIEWLGRLNQMEGPVLVASRPEPYILKPLTRKIRKKSPAENTVPIDTYSWALPRFYNRRAWWLQSRNSYRIPDVSKATPAIIWNPLVGISNIWHELGNSSRPICMDLLDDWSIHYAFEPIRTQIELAYRRIFERVDFVTANAEGTLALARRFGRDDAVLLTNGCDPERFNPVSTAKGRITVGYVGKIGKRLDLDLIHETALGLPEVNFVFAGPILDSEYRPVLEKLQNVTLLGDVHYNDVPELLQTFDIGWVPHNVGDFEVGGDVIKTYEYRAAHLPVLTTPIGGAGERNLDSVYVVPASEHVNWIGSKIADYTRIARESGEIPTIHTWRDKAEFILNQLRK
ncbi:glycosyltransferase [Arthrobacter sp. ISL-30]|uniref:glycosyltransferase n=1 Tax=Arthrobacter sp. ISL-30 TaxID=2819109 RepID=UPI001BEBCA13|nr:glycosyltransferase [Arthrobacter sp. ISL-30]MBT2515739.1 glycosyltransferase [Arthrobacter sp. ISL-30]